MPLGYCGKPEALSIGATQDLTDLVANLLKVHLESLRAGNCMIFVGIHISESYAILCLPEGQEEDIRLVGQAGQYEHPIDLGEVPLDGIQTSKKLFFLKFYSFLEMFQTLIMPSAEDVTAKLALLRKLFTIFTG